MEGTKHLVECMCILPQLKGRPNQVFHKFVVFSVIDDDGNVQSSHAQCNNCGAVHKVTDICKSEILIGKDELKSMISEKDIKLTLPSSLSNVLETYSCDLATWQLVQFAFHHQKWGTWTTLVKEELEDGTSGKILRIDGPTNFRVEPFNTEDM
jgi:hypothetical protein